MGNFTSILERILHTADFQKPSTTEKPSLDSEVPATLGGANAEPDSLRRPEHVDLAAILDKLSEQSGHQLDWRHSVVDLLKTLNADSSLEARQELADEFGYSGDKTDAAAMDVWLRKALLNALAENGDRIARELRE